MAVLASLLDKHKRAVARAKFHAWWHGVEFEPPEPDNDTQEVEEPPAANGADTPLEAATPAAPAAPVAAEAQHHEEEAPISPRLAALALIWGEGRIAPGDDAAEALTPARVACAEMQTLHVMGAGCIAPLAALARAHPGSIVALEWREETRDALALGLERMGLGGRVVVKAVDLDTYAPDAASIEALVSFDEFTYAANAPRLAQQIMKALKPGAVALIECYAAVPAPPVAPAFASAFAEPQIRPSGDLEELFKDAGLTVSTNEDCSAAHVVLAKSGFKRLERVLARAADGGVSVRVMQEIAWEATAWKQRLKLLAQHRLERRSILVRKPARG